MLKQRFVFAVSLFAMFSVGVARADIAATSYVDAGVNAANTAASNAQKSADNAGTAASNAQTSANNAQAAAENAQKSADAAAASAKTANDTVATKQDKSTAVTHVASMAVGGTTKPVYVASSGAAMVVTGIDASLLPNATAATKGGVIVGSNISVSNGTISVPTANGTSLGLVKQGTNITIGTDGTISAKDTTYSTGTATASGLTKLYTTTGTATDGTMTQAALNTALSDKQEIISDLSAIRSGAEAGATAVQAVTTGTDNGTISVDGADVAVKGLGSAAYTASTQYATSAQGTKADAALPKATFDGMLSTSENGENGKIPTVGFMMDSIGDAQSEIGGSISAINAALSGKQSTLTTTNVKSDGTGNVVTAVTAANGVVTVTKGTTLGSLATKSTVASADITDGAVTVAKTSGVYGYIPTKNSTGAVSGTAEIWVE